MTSSVDARDLVLHLDAVRSLARALVRDRDLAEDLTQETCVVALRRRRSDLPWLGGVVRNLARQAFRASARRAHHEPGAASPPAPDDPAALAQTADVVRRIVAELLELEEPQRSTLLRHFFEGLSPKEIAERTGEPEGTVRSRLKRGLDILRGRLDREHAGERKGWSAALAVSVARAAAPGRGESAAVTGATIMAKTSTTVIGAVIALLLGFAVGRWSLGTNSEARESQTSDAIAALQKERDELRAQIGERAGSTKREIEALRSDLRTARQEAADARKQTASAPAPSNSPPKTSEAGGGSSPPAAEARRFFPIPRVKGRVIDLATSQPIEGVHVNLIQYDSGETMGAWGGTTGSSGSFEVGPAKGERRFADRVELRARAPGYRDGFAAADEGATISLERRDRPLVSGRVLGMLTDNEDHPVTGRVQINGTDSAGEWFGQWTICGPDGSFVLEGVRPGPWRFHTEAAAARAEAVVPEGGEARIHLRLRGAAPRAAASETTREIRIEGLPVEGAPCVRLQRPGTRQFWRTAAHDGRAVLPAIPAGSWNLVLELGDTEGAPRSVDVAAGEGPFQVDWSRPSAR